MLGHPMSGRHASTIGIDDMLALEGRYSKLFQSFKAAELVHDPHAIWEDAQAGADFRRDLPIGFEKSEVDPLLLQHFGERQPSNAAAHNDNFEVGSGHLGVGSTFHDV